MVNMVRSLFPCLTRTNHKARFAGGRHIQIENTVIITHFKGRRENAAVANDSGISSELLYTPSAAVQFVLPLHCILGILANIADP